MNILPNYLIIPALWLTVLWLGSALTSSGMAWYLTLVHSAITPPSWVFVIAWNTIFVCAILSTILIWNRMFRDRVFWSIVILLCINGITNLLWTYFFFYCHFMGLALIDAIVLLLCTWILVMVLWIKHEKLAALLFVPYALWLVLAVYLNWMFILLN